MYFLLHSITSIWFDWGLVWHSMRTKLYNIKTFINVRFIYVYSFMSLAFHCCLTVTAWINNWILFRKFLSLQNFSHRIYEKIDWKNHGAFNTAGDYFCNFFFIWLTNYAYCQEWCNAWQHNRLIRQLPLYKISPLLSLILSRLQINYDFTVVFSKTFILDPLYFSKNTSIWPSWGAFMGFFFHFEWKDKNQLYESNLFNIAVLIYSIHCILSTVIINLIFSIRCNLC